jgi:hypothetical protein
MKIHIAGVFLLLIAALGAYAWAQVPAQPSDIVSEADIGFRVERTLPSGGGNPHDSRQGQVGRSLGVQQRPCRTSASEVATLVP